MPGNVSVVDHPLVQHKLSIMRDKQTDSVTFRALMSDVAKVLGLEAIKAFPLSTKPIQTPLMETSGHFLDCGNICLVSVLRAGNGFSESLSSLIPEAPVAHVGLFRDPVTYQAIEYYFKVPPNMPECNALVLDPMLATGHSAVAALDKIKQTNPKSICFICLVAAPEGIKYLQSYHPDVPVYTAAVDDGLNEKKYIIPGLGDAGDRLYRTQ